MRVVVIGATGNVGLAVVRRLTAHPDVTDVVGIARRPPAEPTGALALVRWVSCDVSRTDAGDTLRRELTGADAAVHLAWLIQPGHDEPTMAATNVGGSRRVFDAVLEAKVPALVYASSVGAYSPGPKDRRVDETWATDGVATSAYSRHKVAVERMLDGIEADTPALRVVRMRPGLIFQKAAASEVARYFLGPFLPLSAVQRRFLPAVPRVARLRFQALHTDDAAAAYVQAVTGSVRGPFNLAAEPVFDPDVLGEVLHARPVPIPQPVLRRAVDLAWRARVQPADVGWVDLALGVPLMDTTRARRQLGWQPVHDAREALLELLTGMRHGWGAPTPVLRPAPAPLGRIGEAVRTIARGGAGR